MKSMDLIHSPSYYVEFSQDTLRAIGGEVGLELPLQRQPDGRLTEACREKATFQLHGFLKRNLWQPRSRVFCAIGARGVSLRRLTLPASSQDELMRLLLLQIESEFPLPPDELAWGFHKLGDARPGNGSTGKQELLVAAVKKEALEDYAQIFSACGATPIFTLAALARSSVCLRPPAAYAVLDIGERSSELAAYDRGLATALRVLPWGAQALAPELLPVTAEPSKVGAGRAPLVSGDNATALAFLVRFLNDQFAGRKIYITGNLTVHPEIATQLARAIGGEVECEAIKLASGEGHSAALLGLQQVIERDRAWPAIVLQAKPTNGHAAMARPAPLRWAALAVALALVALALPYAEAILLKPRLARKLAALKTETSRLTTVDRELDFLQYLKQNQPPYLDAMFLLAKSAPPGARFDSLSMSRRGDLSLRGSMKDVQQLADFRTKLIDSGCFTNAAVEEQTPTPDRQKIMVRMTAQWKGTGGRGAFDAALAREPEKPKTTGKEPSTNSPPGAAAAPVPAASKAPAPRKETNS